MVCPVFLVELSKNGQEILLLFLLEFLGAGEECSMAQGARDGTVPALTEMDKKTGVGVVTTEIVGEETAQMMGVTGMTVADTVSFKDWFNILR